MKFVFLAALLSAASARFSEDDDLDMFEDDPMAYMQAPPKKAAKKAPTGAVAKKVEKKLPAVTQEELDDESSSSEEPAAKYTPRQQKSAKERVRDPLIKARFEYARDACKNKADHKKKACFKRNWKLYKPHQKNTIHDFRARTHRDCWQYRNHYVKLQDCFSKYIKDYEDELYKVLLAEAEGEMEEMTNEQPVDV